MLAHDGGRGFCRASVDRVRALAAPALEAVPWQSLLAEVTAPHLERLDREVLLLRGGVVLAGGADAVARYVGASPPRTYRVLAAVVRIPSVRACACADAHAVYRRVSRNRHRLPGGSSVCAVPPREA
ncbi:thiol-disulfide oxidoreductase DCC family protein [Streptomyces sp. NPDC101213]|uniref:thiol-disulfide oxidoreductase DCC family protein n=1 Tax=Streptomyces sp. NPDC101213 TaxID=3366130 RepID=UPI003803D562